MGDRGHSRTSESARQADVKRHPFDLPASKQEQGSDRKGARTSDGDCVFCAIIAGATKGEILFRDDSVIAFLDHRPLQRGHTLVAPIAHVPTLDDLPEAQIGTLFSRVRLVKLALEAALRSDGAFIALNDRVSQSVPHLHVHVVPRWKNDGLFSRALVWKRQPYRTDDEMTAVAASVRAAFASARSSERT